MCWKGAIKNTKRERKRENVTCVTREADMGARRVHTIGRSNTRYLSAIAEI